jgi:hypothetical protein
MDIERNTDVLNHDLAVITRVLGKVAILLSLVCCATYVAF